MPGFTGNGADENWSLTSVSRIFTLISFAFEIHVGIIVDQFMRFCCVLFFIQLYI